MNRCGYSELQSSMRRVLYLFAASFFLLLAPGSAWAQANNFVPLANYNNSVFSSITNTTDLASYINTAFKISLGIGAILTVLMLMYGGYLYAGSEMWTSKQRAKEVITNAVIGLFFLLGL